MWKKILFISILTTAITTAKEKPGAISAAQLEQIQKTVTMNTYTKAMMHAVSANAVQKLAFNRRAVQGLDFHFAHKIETKGITNQKSSGRCWLFTALNTIRPRIIKKYNLKSFEFSENYLYFWDQFEKANLFLEAVIDSRKKPLKNREVEWLFKNPIGDGGVWNMMTDLVGKYGLVPREAMAESFNSENSRSMQNILRRKLREQGFKLRTLSAKGKKIETLRQEKLQMLAEVYRILVISLGLPPQTFQWRYVDKEGSLSAIKEYTPRSFYAEFVEGSLQDYVQLMDDPSKEYYKLYEIKYDRNRYDGHNWTFVNLPSAEIKRFAKKSVLADEPMYFSCDVGKQLNKDEGILALNQYDYESVYGVPFRMNKKERILTFDSGSSHGMALMGLDTTATGAVSKWLLENSWGKKAGHEGYLIMTDGWFDEYMFRLVVRKKFVSQKVRTVLKQKPRMLAPWDAMF